MIDAPAVVARVAVEVLDRPRVGGRLARPLPANDDGATADPDVTELFATGFWLMTTPVATVVLDCVVIGPTVSVAVVIAVCAAACVSPTTFGTVTGGGPEDTTSATADPGATELFATGF